MLPVQPGASGLEHRLGASSESQPQLEEIAAKPPGRPRGVHVPGPAAASPASLPNPEQRREAAFWPLNVYLKLVGGLPASPERAETLEASGGVMLNVNHAPVQSSLEVSTKVSTRLKIASVFGPVQTLRSGVSAALPRHLQSRRGRLAPASPPPLPPPPLPPPTSSPSADVG